MMNHHQLKNNTAQSGMQMGAEHLAAVRVSWKKGQSGNPGGRQKLPEELRAIKALSQEEVCRRVAKFARMEIPEVEAYLQAGRGAIIDQTIAKIFFEASKKGDFLKLGFLLDRAIGKLQPVIPADEESEAIKEIQDLSDQELIRLVKDKLPELEAPIGA